LKDHLLAQMIVGLICEVGLISESKCGVLQLSGLYKNSVKRGLI